MAPRLHLDISEGQQQGMNTSSPHLLKSVKLRGFVYNKPSVYTVYTGVMGKRYT